MTGSFQEGRYSVKDGNIKIYVLHYTGSDISESIVFTPSYTLYGADANGQHSLFTSCTVTHNVDIRQVGIAHRTTDSSTWWYSMLNENECSKNPIAFTTYLYPEGGKTIEFYFYATSITSKKQYKSAVTSVYIPGVYNLDLEKCTNSKIVNSNIEFDAIFNYGNQSPINEGYCEYNGLGYKGSLVKQANNSYTYHFSISRREDGKYSFKIN